MEIYELIVKKDDSAEKFYIVPKGDSLQVYYQMLGGSFEKLNRFGSTWQNAQNVVFTKVHEANVGSILEKIMEADKTFETHDKPRKNR
jgi:hypothetical protein